MVYEVVDLKSGCKFGFGELVVKVVVLLVFDMKSVLLKVLVEFCYIGKGKMVLIDGCDIVGGWV